MSNDIDNLREQAARCARLAKDCANSGVTESLMVLAAEYLERAAKLSGSAAGTEAWQELQPKPAE
jgi:hypothetical protein